MLDIAAKDAGLLVPRGLTKSELRKELDASFDGLGGGRTRPDVDIGCTLPEFAAET